MTRSKKLSGAADALDIRERLLQSALRIFTRKGYAATTVREIVAEAGVAKPALYYYFESKEGIYRVLIQRFMANMGSIMDSPPAPDRSVREQLLQLADKIHDIAFQNRDALRLMYGIYYGPPQGAPFFNFDDIHIDFFEYVREIVRQGIRSGELEPGRDDDMALLYIGATYGAIEDLICDHPIIIDRYQLKRIIHLLFRGIETKHEKAQ